MKAEYQFQIDAIKGVKIYYVELEKLIFITDGHAGVYLSERELKIDKSKMIQMKPSKDSISFSPENLLKERTPAKESNIAYKMNSKWAIKLSSKDSGEYCYVQEKYLKMFKGYNSIFIKSPKDPVLIYRYGVPYGIILPVRILGEEES